MTQVLLNLLLNAADAAAGKGAIAVTVAVDADAVSIHVDDSGPGISQQAAERIFDPFFTTKEPGQGTGLGLAVCDRMVATAGGDLRYEPGPLGGARFTVLVPRAPEQSA